MLCNVNKSLNVCLFLSSRWKSLSYWNKWQFKRSGVSFRGWLRRTWLYRVDNRLCHILRKSGVSEWHSHFFIWYNTVFNVTRVVDQPNCSERNLYRLEFREECQRKVWVIHLTFESLVSLMRCDQCAKFNLDQKRDKRCLYYNWMEETDTEVLLSSSC